MDSDLQTVLDEAMRELVTRLGAAPGLGPELQRARREFQPGAVAAPVPGRGVVEAGERRFFEWFALERYSEILGEVPVAVPRFAVAESLMGSCVGVFTVTSSGEGLAVARDLQDDTLLDLMVPTRSLAVGDLVVGRLFPVGVGQWLPSVAATVFRPGGSLAAAFRQDTARLQLGRRLQQVELEHLLLQQQGGAGTVGDEQSVAPPLEHLEADLDALLTDGGPSATAISERLAEAPRPGAVMGPLLDELAFESEVDLDAARRILLQIWNAHHADGQADSGTGAQTTPDDTSAPRPDETLGEQMVRTLEDGLRQHRDVDGLFAELEEMAGLEPGSADDAENPHDRTAVEHADTETSGLAGTLDPLVQEYLWESGNQDSPAAVTLRLWVDLQSNAAVPRVDLEEVTGLDLMRLLMHVYLAASPSERVAAVRAAFAAVEQFFGWAARTQELELGGVVTDCRGGLLDHLDRLAEASLRLSSAGTPSGQPAMMEVVDVTDSGFGLCGEDSGNVWIDAAADTAARLRVGDIVLSAISAAGALAGPVVVLPPDARKLID